MKSADHQEPVLYAEIVDAYSDIDIDKDIDIDNTFTYTPKKIQVREKNGKVQLHIQNLRFFRNIKYNM